MKSINLTHLIISLLLCAVSVSITSCNKTDVTAKPKTLTALEIIAKTKTTYQKTKHYSDDGLLTLKHSLFDELVVESYPFATRFSRVEGFRLKWFKARVDAGNTELACRIFDIPTENMDGQCVLKKYDPTAPLAELTSDAIASHYMFGRTDMPWAEEIQSQTVEQIPAAWPLLNQTALPTWLAESNQFELLEVEEVEGHKCHQVSAQCSLGKYIAWIDQATFVIRKLSLAPKVLASALSDSKEIAKLSIVAEFKNATFESPTESGTNYVFSSNTSPQDKIVSFFVSLPDEFPSEMIGRRVGSYSFRSTDGTTISREDFEGKTTILLFYKGFFRCEKVFRDFAKLKDFLDSDRYRIAIVCSDPVEQADDRLVEGLANSWGWSGSVLRDLDRTSERYFGVREVPSVLILNQQSVVQYSQSFHQATSELDSGTIGTTLVGVDKGTDFAAKLRANYQKHIAEYQSDLEKFKPVWLNRTGTVSLVKSDPKTFKLVRIWEQPNIVAPGNVLLDDFAQPKRVFVCEGWQTLAEVSLDGKLIQRHRLPIPSDAVVNRLLLAKTSDQSFLVGYSKLGKRGFVFNSDLKYITAFPGIDDQHNGIQRVQVENVSAGLPRILVDMPPIGIRTYALSGKVINNTMAPEMLKPNLSVLGKSFNNAVSVSGAVSPTQNGWWLGTESGEIALIQPDGSVVDRLSLGEPIRGLCLHTANGNLELIISVPGMVWAFRVDF